MSALDNHLSGPVLEALAAGDTAEMPGMDVSAHLKTCARCRETLEAMKMENALFAGEFSQRGVVNAKSRSAGVSSRTTLRVHRPFVYYSVAALLMLAVAVKLVWKDAPPSNNAVGTKVADKSVTEVGDDKKKPKDEKSKDGDPVYEGKTVAQWVAELKKIFAANPELHAGTTHNNEEPILVALKELGPQSVRELLRWAGEEERWRATIMNRADQVAAGVIKGGLTDADQQELFAELSLLLNDKDYAQRRAGIYMLGTFAAEYRVFVPKIREALTAALNDADRAVIKAARSELESLPNADQQKSSELERLQADYEAAVQRKSLIEAGVVVEKIMKLDRELGRKLHAALSTHFEEKKLTEVRVKTLIENAGRLARDQKLKEAGVEVAKALELEPGNLEAVQLQTDIARFERGLINGNDIGARASAPTGDVSLQNAKRLLAAAQGYAAQGKFAEALALSKEAMALAPQDAEMKLQVAQLGDQAAKTATAKAKSPGEIDPFDEKRPQPKSSKPTAKGSVGAGEIDPFDGKPAPAGVAISVDFNKTPLKDAVADIAKKAGVNITIANGIRGEITVKLDKLPWDAVLRNVAAKVGARASVNLAGGTAQVVKVATPAGELDPFDQ